MDQNSLDLGGFVFGVTDFVAVLNQTLEYAYPAAEIVGELANFRVSKGKWVYFDLKDEYSSVKFFGTVYQLPGPLEDGMMLQVRGVPRLHPQYGFSMTTQFIQPVGEGSLRKASQLLEAKLAAEGLFAEGRKRRIPYPAARIGLITSGESAAYHDFVKILDERWRGVEVLLADVQVQGEPAINQIVAAIEHFNVHGTDVDVLVITRGGGSAEDLAAFSTEQVTRAVAGSRIPTIVAIGHEVDVSLAELAADLRASTPSNAAQMLVPDRKQLVDTMRNTRQGLESLIVAQIRSQVKEIDQARTALLRSVIDCKRRADTSLGSQKSLLDILSPRAVFARGYAALRHEGSVVRSIAQIHTGDVLDVQLQDGNLRAKVI